MLRQLPKAGLRITQRFTGRHNHKQLFNLMEITMQTILVTGSKGLVGKKLCAQLRAHNIEVIELDLVGNSLEYGDVTNSYEVIARLENVTGIIHLAAVSRVVWGEKDPEKCWNVNVNGTANVLNAALESPHKPWVLSVSSREVYGNVLTPVVESAPYNPASVYGKTKVEGEKLTLAAREKGLVTGIVRLSNVYGSADDHFDRVIPAFVKAAIDNTPLCVESGSSQYDFTHVSDAVNGIHQYAELLNTGVNAPILHFLTNTSTSLDALALKTIATLNSTSTIVSGTPRTYGAGKFLGSNQNARVVLNWEPKIDLEQGIKMLGQEFYKIEIIALENSILTTA
jgi:UDP-glucose 4-epimerase